MDKSKTVKAETDDEKCLLYINDNSKKNRHFVQLTADTISIDNKVYALSKTDLQRFVKLYKALGCKEESAQLYAKPVIYLYPKQEQNIVVKLRYDGRLVNTVPRYEPDGGWNVTAYPDGKIMDRTDGKTYDSLFWNGISAFSGWDLSKGYVVAGGSTASFLKKTLLQMGLTQKESEQFIAYWAPRMNVSKYNLITFQTAVYEQISQLDITPKPDSVLRVFMAYRPLKKPVEIQQPVITPFQRRGFTVVEWGGTRLNP